MAVYGLPRVLQDDVIHIGAPNSGALVRIDGADACHAQIEPRRKGHGDYEWWISGLESTTGTLLNGNRLEKPTRLRNDDLITIAGVDIRFSGDRLIEDHSKARGVRVSVRDVSDERGGKTVLRSVNFSSAEGEFVGILGPSGCGKSSVIQRIAGLAPYCGQISINGHSVSEDDLRRLIAYLPQNVENALHDDLTVREEMACNRRLFLASGESDKELDSGYLDTLGLKDEADKPVGVLSGGQKRRVAIALALQRQPQLLLMDEPTAGLDPATETEVMSYLQKLAHQGRTVLCATHVMENVRLFDKVLILTGGEENGKSVYFGSPDGLLEHFGVAHYSELYARLRDESKLLKHLPSEGAATDEPWPLPEAPSLPSFLRTVCGYLSRSWKEFSAPFVRSSRWFDVFRPVRTALLQPAVVALGINLACADKLCQLPVDECDGVVTVLFCAALSVFWLGLAGHVQSLVRARIPSRCLERLGGISIARYGVAKLVSLLVACLMQVTVFSVIFFLHSTAVKGSHLHWSLMMGVVLYLVCVTGGLVGLAVSAWSRKTTTAVAAVPVVAVMALLFSQPVIGFKSEDQSEKSIAVTVAQGMPCHKAQVYMSVLNDETKKEKDKAKDKVNDRRPHDFFTWLGAYSLFLVAVGLVGQSRRERQWDGR